MPRGRRPMQDWSNAAGPDPRAARSRVARRRRPRLVCTVAVVGVASYYYVRFARLIDARLHGERERVLPRVFARPLELRRGQSLSDRQLDRSAERPRLRASARASRSPASSRSAQAPSRSCRAAATRTGEIVRVGFERRRRRGKAPPKTPPPPQRDRVSGLERRRAATPDTVTLDAPLLTALISTGEREKRRQVPLAAIPPRMVQAVLAIEDRRFYEHPGVDPIRHRRRGAHEPARRAERISPAAARSRSSSCATSSSRRSGHRRSERERSRARKLLEQFMSLVLERRRRRTRSSSCT